MISETCINGLLLICDENCIVQNLSKILHVSDEDLEFYFLWTLCEENQSIDFNIIDKEFAVNIANQSLSNGDVSSVVNALSEMKITGSKKDDVHETKNMSNVSSKNWSSIKIHVSNMICLKISLAAGFCVQNFWHIDEFLRVNISIIEQMCLYCCNKYVRYIVFAFQTLKQTLESVTLKQPHTLQLETLQIVFEVILGNWENYLPAVLENNLELCECFVNFMKQSSLEVFQLTNFWQYVANISCTFKSKYYIMGVCFLANFYPENVLNELWFLENLAYSLTRSYLVTAGAYCYKILIKRILTENRWTEIFLDKVVQLVCDPNIVIRQNVCNYWLPVTVQKHCAIIQVLFDRVNSKYRQIVQQCIQVPNLHLKNRNIDQVGRYLHSIVLIIKLEKCNSVSELKREYIHRALKCSDELIRADAFLCCQTFKGVKCLIKMDRESKPGERCWQSFSEIFNFLEENINCDDASLRQTIYKVFKNYVLNMESELHKIVVPLKKLEGFSLPESYFEICRQFLILHTFLIKNLNVDGNYQRVITTLNLMNIILEHFQPRLTENQKKKRVATIDVMRQCNDWQFENASTRESIFNCLRDDNNDVRGMAKHLLQSYFRYELDEFQLFVDNLESSLKMSRSNVFYTAESGAYCVSVLAHLFYKSQFDESDEILKEINAQSSESTQNDIKAFHFLHKTNSSASLKNVFVTYLLNQCLDQSELLQKDILSAVKLNSSLHGSLTTLMLVLTDPTSPEFCQLDSNRVEALLNLLNETCLYLLDILSMKSRCTNFAPSFGEMGEAINSLINEGGEDENLTLSPAHQVLFNCIWMNLKVCCTFASEVAVAYKKTFSRDQVIFCCDIISYVLHKCRHKGAIQNAGLALSNLISKCLFDDEYPSHLLQQTLESTLNCVVGGTVSRKSAGVAILIHKILASNHSMKDKLFKITLDRLIKVADSPVIPSEDTLKVDLPQATAFHMLQFLVADSTLRVPMFFYLERMTSLCFDKMQSQEWTVRNAALQVFGALLPKLVGTKKQDSEEQISNVAFEEFFYQLPRISDCLKSVFSLDLECNTSVLVSALTLLSRLKIVGAFFTSSSHQSHLKQFFRDLFKRFLSSNIYTVRFLAANCLVNCLQNEFEHNFKLIFFSCLEFMFGPRVLYDHFSASEVTNFLECKNREKIINENHLHGSLLTLEYLKNKMSLENIKLNQNFAIEVLTFLRSNQMCQVNVKFCTFSILYKVFREENEQTRIVRIENEQLSKIDKNLQTEIGWKLYALELIKFQMHNSLVDESGFIDFKYLANLIGTLQYQPDLLRDTLKYLLLLLKNYSQIYVIKIHEQSDVCQEKCIGDHCRSAQNTIKVILNMLTKLDNKVIYLEVLCEVIIEIYGLFIDATFIVKDVQHMSIANTLLTKYIDLDKDKRMVMYVCPLILPVISICYICTERSFSRDMTLNRIMETVQLFIHDKNCNEDFRFAAAKCLTILCENDFIGAQSYLQESYLNSIYLLQDEVLEVRNEIIYFVRSLVRRHQMHSDVDNILLQNPYVSLVSLIGLKLIDPLVGMQLLFDLFSLLEEDFLLKEDEFNNPFDHNIRNFFWETVEIAQRAKTTLIEMNKRKNYKQILLTLFEKCRTQIDLVSLGDLNDRGRLKVSCFYELGQALLSSNLSLTSGQEFQGGYCSHHNFLNFYQK